MNDSCVACMADNNCGVGGLCLPNGACARSDNIIHASTGGMDVPGCGQTGSACTLERALIEVTATRNVIKLDDHDPAIYIPATNNFVVNVNVTIDARDAILHKKDNGPILTISAGKIAAIFGGMIEGATGTGGDGIQCASNATLTVDGTTFQANAESGIDASSCTLMVSNANIHDNSKASAGTLFAGIEVSQGSITISQSKIVSNKGGGITVNNNGKFAIVGNMFLSNGDPTVAAGGVSLTTATPGNRLEFNTFAENKSITAIGVGSGIQCLVTGFTAKNNIVWNNNGSSGVQVGGNCQHAYSDIGPMAVPGGPTGLDGGNNSSSDPMFVNPTMDLHVKSGSPVQGRASSTADLTGIASKDIDGHPRVAPADLGAYVVPAQ